MTKESRADVLTIAAGLFLALAAFYFLQALVEGLIAPVVAAVFGEPGMHSLEFTINESEFAYGGVITASILLALAVAAVVFLGRRRLATESRSGKT